MSRNHNRTRTRKCNSNREQRAQSHPSPKSQPRQERCSRRAQDTPQGQPRVTVRMDRRRSQVRSSQPTCEEAHTGLSGQQEVEKILADISGKLLPMFGLLCDILERILDESDDEGSDDDGGRQCR
ncbi:hypothetical protein N7462_003168 [Penicillium macrosclerotiorum]|uniref:uncharacterized protein n=1 Tax=Penicillium macrosclerotiorum TaxID=303699 RepID=UPI0025491C9C|nr:uncharacterized protein N7462_003168 [Penicillium macrosclerotiorum]KAJ5688776.1 hypothetical protein N7462_003168 [Penicillium macrosclerotiorum]